MRDTQEQNANSYNEEHPKDLPKAKPVDLDSVHLESCDPEASDHANNSEKKLEKDVIESPENWEYKSRLADTERKLKESEDELITYKERFRRYKETINLFEKEARNHDYKIMGNAKKDYDKWNNYFLNLVDFYNDLYNELIDIVEDRKFNIRKMKTAITFPFDIQFINENMDSIKDMLNDASHEIDKSDIDNELKEKLLVFSGLNVRAGTDLDYFFFDEGSTKSELLLQKKSLNTLLLIFKNIVKTRDEIIKVQRHTLEAHKKVTKELEYFDPVIVLEALFDREESSFDSVMEKLGQILQENYKTYSEAEAVSDKFRKKYFDLLNKTLFQTYNSLREASRHYEESLKNMKPNLSELTRLRKWCEIYTSLETAILSFLRDKLEIEMTDCSRGDNYDEYLHVPHSEAEPDDDLENNRIKRIINVGFKLITDNTIIKQVDVIVVNNHIKG